MSEKRFSGDAGSADVRRTCTDIAPLLLFYVCDELSLTDRGAVELHVSDCSPCAAALAQHGKLQGIIAEAKQPADELDPAAALLAQCRSELDERLDDLATAKPSWSLLPQSARALHPLAWLSMVFVAHPALCTAVLILLGASLGIYGPQWLPAHRPGDETQPVMTVSSTPRITPQELTKMGVAGISFAPGSTGSGSGTVELRLTAEKPMVIEGSLDDSDIRQVLTYVVANGQRFDEGVRLDCLDALRAHTADSQVRQVLLSAARQDRNPAVRLRALEALRSEAGDESVREALLESLLKDNNPGVRVEAINSLVNSLPKAPDAAVAPNVQHVMNVLENLTRRDPNNYVRIQSAAALRQLGPRELH